MANGERTPDPEDHVLRTEVRSGLKREFVFALKAQNQIPVSLSRTRSGKPRAVGTRERKRSKKLSIGDPTPTDAGIHALGLPEVADPPLLPPNDGRIEGEANVAVDGEEKSAADANPNTSSLPHRNYAVADLKDETMAAVVDVKDDAIVGKSLFSQECKNEAITVTPVAIESYDKDAVDAPQSLSKPFKVFVRSPKRGRTEVSRKSSPDLVSSPGLVPTCSNDIADHDTCVLDAPSENGCTIESLTKVDYNSDSIVSIMTLVNPAEVYRRRSAENETSEMAGIGNGCSMENLTIFHSNGDSNVDSMVKDNAAENHTSETAAIGASAIPVIVNEAQPVVETPNGLDSQDAQMIRNRPSITPSITPSRRFTRSMLNVTPFSQADDSADVHSVKENDQDRPVDEVSRLDQLTRRFTRSLLKVKMEDPGAGDDTGTSSDSNGSEETINGGSVDRLDSTDKKKMELKMSKKIALTKPPSNIRELISSGLLEGLPVNYILYNQIELQGVIRGNGILCSCASCNTSNVVSAYVFEQHAGSTKKHPSDFIYLQNGNNLRDVLKACTGASLDSLEAAILSAAGPWPLKTSFNCQKCKEFFLTTRTGKFALLCDECLNVKQAPKTPASNSNPISSRVSRVSLAPSSSDSQLKNLSATKKVSYGKLTRKDVGLHKLVFMDDILPQGTEVGYYVRGKRLLQGYIKESGICCPCCDKVISPSQFEAHAGRASRRKPYNNIYTSNGVSLHELSVSLSKDRKISASENDDLCSICADGGNLLLCDLCPRAFHKECVGLSTIPTGDWYCRYCINLRERERSVASNDNAIAAGRVAGVDPIDQIFRRCIRIVTTSETDIGGCVFCRLHHFSKSAFDDQTVIICDQCEKEYHIGCLRDNKMVDLKEVPEGEWFCCTDCSSIRASLQELVLNGAQPISLLDLDLIKKKYEDKGVTADITADIRWRLLSGQVATEETKMLLSRAVALFHESFDPINDAGTGRDLIPTMVYGREVRDQDYRGVYCAILTVGSSVVSAGTLRVMGSTVAELPLAATSKEHQGLGYFQILFSYIERLLGSLNVKHFVLPAADDAQSIWTKKFHFTKINSDQLKNYTNGNRTTFFEGTSMLHKLVPSAKNSGQEEEFHLLS